MPFTLLTVAVFLCSCYQGFVNAQDPQWFQYTTQVLGNERHDGFRKVPLFPKFYPAINMSKPAWTTKFTSTVRCNYQQVLVAKQKIYCVYGNKVNAFDINTGELTWSYVVIGATINSFNYVGGVKKSSTGGVIVVPGASSLVLLDASTGNFLTQKVLGPASEYKVQGYLTTTQNGIVSGNVVLFERQSAVFSFDINQDSVRLGNSRLNVTNDFTAPTICGENEEITIVSDGCGGTTAYTKSSNSPTTLTPIWRYSVICTSSFSTLAPVCYKNAATGTHHVIAASLFGRVCYEFEANGDGKVLATFPCTKSPLIHYNAVGNADFAVFESVASEIVVSRIGGKTVIGKELWVGTGNTFSLNVIGNYLVDIPPGTVNVRVYQIEDGKMLTDLRVENFGGFVVEESSRNSYTIAVVSSQDIVAYRF